MRYRKPFTLHPRTFSAGKIIYYYQAYDEEGARTTSRSTGQTTKTAARAYCNKLYKEGRLLPRKNLTFGEYAENWRIYDKCDYIKGKLSRGFSFSPMYADIQRMNMKNHIFPTFEKVKLHKITGGMIEKWLFSMRDKGYASKSVNHYLTVLRIMLNEAYRLGTIKRNPMKTVKPLKVESKKKDILTKSEFKKLFDPQKMGLLWDSPTHYIASLLSACTGMRLGEVQALRGEYVFPDYAHVCHIVGTGSTALRIPRPTTSGIYRFMRIYTKPLRV